MIGQILAEQTFCTCRLLARAVPSFETKSVSAAPRADKADQCCAQNYDWERHIKEEDADESGRREQTHGVVLEGALANSENRLQHNRKDRRFQTEEQCSNYRHISVEDIDVAQGHDGNDAGDHKQ